MSEVKEQDRTRLISGYEGPRDVCYICGKEAVAYCDYVLNTAAPFGPLVCDRPLCQEHTHRPFQSLDLDYCPEHCLCSKGERP